MTHAAIAGLVLLTLAAQAPRAHHVDHQPAHEGIFVTAANDTLHLEAVWAAPGKIRLFVTDRTGRPLPAARVQALNLRVVEDGRETPLHPSEHDHDALEGSISAAFTVPRRVTLVLKPPSRAETAVTFTFPSFTGGDTDTITIPPTKIPKTRAEILGLLVAESRETQALSEGTGQQSAYVALTRVRDLALALQQYLPALPAGQRTRADSAIREAVRTSWLLHASLDEGLPGQSKLAVIEVHAAVEELLDAFGGPGAA